MSQFCGQVGLADFQITCHALQCMNVVDALLKTGVARGLARK